jgi:hypothetical protein
MDRINRSPFYLKHEVSETGFCLQVEPTQLGQIDRASFCLLTGSEERVTDISSIYWAQLRRFDVKSYTDSSLQNVMF